MVPTEELEQYPRRPWWRRLLIPGVAIVIVVVGVAIPASRKDDLPDFELERLDETGTLASEDLKGSPVVLNFFAGWCQPCREEAPILQATYEEYKDRGVRFVGIATNDTRERALGFAQDFDITYDVVMGDDELEQELGINGLPQTLFVNRSWELSSVAAGEAASTPADDEVGGTGTTTVLGAIDKSELRAGIEAMLEGD